MNDWQQGFMKKMESLREQWARRFEVFAAETLEPVFHELEEFVQRCELRGSAPQAQKGLRSFKFSLTEDAYVLISFRNGGVDAVQCEYECCIPGRGTSEGVRSDALIRSTSEEWVEGCFQMALDDFIARFAEAERLQGAAQPALV